MAWKDSLKKLKDEGPATAYSNESDAYDFETEPTADFMAEDEEKKKIVSDKKKK